MSPERNYGYEMVEQNEELKHILDSSSQIESAFDYEKYGRAYTEGGEVTVLEDGYIDNCADGPDEDYYDRDELVSLIGDRYDAQYPAGSSKTADRSLSHRQEVPFTLFAWLKLSPITVKSPISLFFFVRFYHLSSKKGHP